MRRRERVWLLLAAIAVLVVGWMVLREEHGVTQTSSRTDATAATSSTPDSPEHALPPRTELTQEPPAIDPREQVPVHGKVYSPDREARLAGEVDITYWDQDREEEQHATATIQPDHTFRLTLPRGVHLRRAEAQPEREDCNWRQTFLSSEEKLDESEPLESDREILLLRVTVGFVISGHVVDQASRLPIAKARIARAAEPPVETNPDGEFRLPCEFWSSTPTPLVVGFAVKSADHLGTEIDVPEPEVGTEAVVAVALQRGVKLRGRVIDADGRGVMAGLRAMQDVGQITPLGRRIAHCVSTRSDRDGRFELPALPPVDHIEVRAISSAHAPARVRDLDLRQEPSELIIRLSASVQFEVVATYPMARWSSRITVTSCSLIRAAISTSAGHTA
jgi:hypothetical protein